MGIKFSEMTDDELGAMVRSRFERLSEAHDMGLTDTHPRDQWNADNTVLRAHRDAKANDEGGLGPVEIQKQGKDTPPEDVPGLVQPHGADGRYVVEGLDGQPRFEHADGRVSLGNDAVLARARQANPNGTRRMNAHIRGLDRLK